MFALSFTVYEIFAHQEKCHNFDLENGGLGVKERDLRHSTRNVRIRKGDFFRISTFTQKVTDNERQG